MDEKGDHMKQTKQKRALCILLCAALLCGSFALSTATALELPAVYAPDFGNWGTQGNNGWYYMYLGTDNVCRNLDYYDASASISWQKNAFAFDPAAMNEMLFISQNSFFTGENGSCPVYCFLAPHTGQITLEFETYGPSGLGLRVLRGRTPVTVNGSSEIAFNTSGYTKHSVSMSISRGERILLQGFTTGSSREGWVRNYQVTYSSVDDTEETSELYSPDLDFGWGVQNNRGWYYLYQDLATGRYTELPYISVSDSGETFTDCFSAHRMFPFCFIRRDTIHPAVNANAVKGFCAPMSGEVRFSVRLRRGAPEIAGSPSLLTVLRGNETLYAEMPIHYYTGDNWDTVDFTVQLFRGEWVYFVLGCNGSNTSGEVQMYESAEYLSESGLSLPSLMPTPSYDGFQIRDGAAAGEKDLRFSYSISKTAFGSDGVTETYEITELGVLWQTADVLQGGPLTAETGHREPITRLVDAGEDTLQYVWGINGIGEAGWKTVYQVCPYVTCQFGEIIRTFYGNTTDACVFDYLCSLDPCYGIVRDPITANLSNGRVSSAVGNIQITPAYITGSSWHSTAKPRTTRVDGNSVISTTTRGTLTTTVNTPSDGSLSITQSASVSSGGIGGVGLSVSFSMDYDVILPAWGGVRLTRAYPDAAPYPTDNPRECIEYPLEWEMQMFIIQGANGGYLIYQQDNGTQYKRLWLSNDGTNFNFTIETVPQAPFSGYRQFTTQPWVVVAYEGDWTVGASLYKQYMDNAFGMADINAAKPDKAAEITAMVLTDLDSNTLTMLQKLATLTDASEIALIVPGWRAERYDENYPDYTPKAGLKSYIQQAQAMGYKVLLHANLIGCDDSSPYYTAYGLEDDRYLDTFSLNPRMESWTTTYSVSFWLMNPASRDWQDLLIAKLTEAYQTLGVDGFHLDQSLVAYNDGRGYVNGMTAMQGVVELERRLAQALPDCIFSGEGTNEFNYRYANFLQRAPYGINSATGMSWSEEKIAQILPVDALLYGSGTRLYHYPAMPTSGSETAYQMWCRAGMRLGALPTLMRSSAYELTNANLSTKQAINLFLWWKDNRPVFHYASGYGTGFVRWRTQNGASVVWHTEELW